MTYPRSHLVDPDGGVYHVCSRCVRRAFLCGIDRQTGYDFNHRRQWIEDRILELASYFALEIYGFAVMSNHYHIVLRVNPDEVDTWSDTEVSNKWLSLSPRTKDNATTRQLRQMALLEDQARLKVIRERLASLSWFMRYLNEPLARLANKEDACKGRFWEGRFKSQRLLDEQAILACMIYVDLNPVRAGITDDVTRGRHTSLAKRIASGDPSDDVLLFPINNPASTLPFDFTLRSYIQLANWTLEVQQAERPTKSGFQGVPPPATWINLFIPKPGDWQRALGSIQSIKNYARDIGQCWIKTRSSSVVA
jgi:hypothetical protein